MQDSGYRIQDTGLRIQDSESETGISLQDLRSRIVHPVSCIMHLFLFVIFYTVAAAEPDSLDAAVAGLQKRYASVENVMGDFRQTYRAPGIDQVESGVFRMKKPCLMRWEYRQPEEKLFIADGRDAFLYVPQDRQVTVQPFSAADLRGTPLELLLGLTDIKKDYRASWETGLKPKAEATLLIRLTPRKSEGEFESIILEIDRNTYDLRRIVLRESGGNTSEFLLSNVSTNTRIENKEFKFKRPKGVELVRVDSE
jgi:outer membrane lipoprotein carrier protein